jgi:hypothetical protein
MVPERIRLFAVRLGVLFASQRKSQQTCTRSAYKYETTRAYKDDPEGPKPPDPEGWQIDSKWSTLLHHYIRWRPHRALKKAQSRE